MYNPGDVVGIDHPKYGTQPWVVEGVGPTNYRLVPQDGGRGLVAPHDMVIDWTPGVGTNPARPVGLRLGSVVRISGTMRGYDGATDLWVVVADKFDTVNVAPLGGDERSRHWKVTPSRLTVIDPADVYLALSVAEWRMS